MPQAPQLARSVWVSTQRPEHAVSEVAHERTQAPLSQTCPAAQRVPQAPQLVRSTRVSAQRRAVPASPSLMEHSVRGAAHCTPQTPMEHTWPVAQATPHAPQLSESLLVDAHRPAQAVCPVGHEVRQFPATQTWPVAQVRPQEPQLARSTERSTQRPVQLIWSVGHGETGMSGRMSATLSTAASPGAGSEPEQPTAAMSAMSAHPPRSPITSRDAGNLLRMRADSFTGQRGVVAPCDVATRCQ